MDGAQRTELQTPKQAEPAKQRPARLLKRKSSDEYLEEAGSPDNIFKKTKHLDLPAALHLPATLVAVGVCGPSETTVSPPPFKNSLLSASACLGIQQSALAFKAFDGPAGSRLNPAAAPSSPDRFCRSVSRTVSLDLCSFQSKNLFPSFLLNDPKETKFSAFCDISTSTFSPVSNKKSSSWLDSVTSSSSSFSQKNSNSAFSFVTADDDDKDHKIDVAADQDVTESVDLSHEFIPVLTLTQKEVLITGEEDEECKFSGLAKLFYLANNNWRERGIGQIKLNKSCSSNLFRLVMRTNVVPRLILNVRVTQLPVTLIGDRYVRFCGVEPRLKDDSKDMLKDPMIATDLSIDHNSKGLGSEQSTADQCSAEQSTANQGSAEQSTADQCSADQ
ncbi:hypothetical protein HK096_010880, partial [Nowakowskiella sp. JEL0078]